MKGTGIEDDKHLIVAVGASGADGLRDMRDLLSGLPEGLSATILCTLHRPPDRESELAWVLRRRSKMEVKIASNGERLRRGCCYIGMPAQHLTLTTGRRVYLLPHIKQHRGKTVDLLFNSVATHAKRNGIGVVLAGSLGDGSQGLQSIKLAGGAVFARSTRDTDLKGMPANAVARAGPLHLVDEIDNLARGIVRRCELDQYRLVQQPAIVNVAGLVGQCPGDHGPTQANRLELRDREFVNAINPTRPESEHQRAEFRAEATDRGRYGQPAHQENGTVHRLR